MLESPTEWIIPTSVLVALIIFVIKSMKDNDTKISRNYQRLDEYRLQADKRFLSKDVFELFLKSIDEIKTDVKEILTKHRS